MKKIIIGLLVFVGAGFLIGAVLSKNKKENEAKIEVVNQDNGYAPVHLTAVSRQDLEMTYSVNGNFMPNRELQLLSENTGVVSKINVEEGDRVSQGQVLAVIDDKYLSLDQQNARDAYQKLLTDKERYESSFKTGGVTQAELDDIELQLRNAGNRLKETQRRSNDGRIKAPISGIINKKDIEVGAYLSPGTSLFEIVDVTTLKLKVAVSENRVAQLRTGDQVEISVPVFPDKTFTGRISFIAPKADETLNFPVEIKVENQAGSPIKAGMYATAVFDAQKIKNVLLIPRNAFVGSINNREVYVLQKDSTVRLKTVVPGMIAGDRVEVLDGLQEGDQVVTTGQINLSDGTRVEVQ